jgi:hypothetical protein
MNIRQMPRKPKPPDNGSFPDIMPVSQVLFLAVGMLVPTDGPAGLGQSQGEPAIVQTTPAPLA